MLLTFKQYRLICEDAQGDLEIIKSRIADIDKRLNDMSRPLLTQKQNLEKQVAMLQKRVQQETATQAKQQQQQQQTQKPQLSTPGSASGSGQPGG